jgi:hypothetical protein
MPQRRFSCDGLIVKQKIVQPDKLKFATMFVVIPASTTVIPAKAGI